MTSAATHVSGLAAALRPLPHWARAFHASSKADRLHLRERGAERHPATSCTHNEVQPWPQLCGTHRSYYLTRAQRLSRISTESRFGPSRWCTWDGGRPWRKPNPRGRLRFAIIPSYASVHLTTVQHNLTRHHTLGRQKTRAKTTSLSLPWESREVKLMMASNAELHSFVCLLQFMDLSPEAAKCSILKACGSSR